MCFPSAPRDNSAEIARQAEEARQSRIRAGTEDVNKTFSQFDDNYYGGVEKAHNDYYMPQIDDQYQDARKQLILNLSRSGGINGSTGAEQLGKIDKSYQTQRGDYANRGVSAAQSMRGDVERNRSEVLSQLSASADPAAAAATANARAQSLTAPPVFNALGKLFSDFVTSGATGLAMERQGYRGLDTGLFQPTRPTGSVKYVN